MKVGTAQQQGRSRWELSSSRSASIADTIDDVQVKKQALQYLCQTNVAWEEVEKFLMRQPEALLFESANDNERIQTQVINQMRICTCFSTACQDNRRMTLMVLRRGFEYYRGFALSMVGKGGRFLAKTSNDDHWEFYACQLKVLQQEMREMKEKYHLVMGHMEKLQSDARRYRLEVEELRDRHEPCTSPLSLLKCQKYEDHYERRAILETNLSQATAIARSLQVDLDLLVREHASARKLQLSLLKTVFAGFDRHVCFANEGITKNW